MEEPEPVSSPLQVYVYGAHPGASIAADHVLMSPELTIDGPTILAERPGDSESMRVTSAPEDDVSLYPHCGVTDLSKLASQLDGENAAPVLSMNDT